LPVAWGFKSAGVIVEIMNEDNWHVTSKSSKKFDLNGFYWSLVATECNTTVWL
jgi:3,4-dihydroxy-2-butanone 4-phosphate synthase